MAHATHLTITTCDRIRLDAGSDDYDEDRNGSSDVRLEVQVSVTYALDPGDANLVVLAERKALEVKLAHEAALSRIGAFSNHVLGNSSIPSNTGPGGSCRPENGAMGDAKAEDADDEDAGDDGNDLDDYPPRDGLPSGSPPVGAWYLPGGSRFSNGNGSSEMGPGPDRETEEESDEEPVTGPQRILIRSRAKKAGLTPYALEQLVFQQFKVWKVERLTKAQAALLLAALERDLKERDLIDKGNGSKVSPLAAGGDYAA